MEERLLTAEELAERLNMNPRVIRRQAADGRIPAVRVGRAWRFEWERVLKELRTKRGDDE